MMHTGRIYPRSYFDGGFGRLTTDVVASLALIGFFLQPTCHKFVQDTADEGLIGHPLFHSF